MNSNGHIIVSIILPNYNHNSFLEARVESILNQSYQNFELIVLDDSSTDASRKTLERWKQHPQVSHFIVNEQNSGSTVKQWKKGLELATGKWIWIAESDDFADVRFLEVMLQFANRNTDCGVLYCQSFDTDVSGSVIDTRLTYTSDFLPNHWASDFVMTGQEFITTALKRKNVIPNASAVLFKRSLISQSTFCRSLLSLKMASDWLFWIRLAKQTNVGFVAEPLNYFRTHGATTRIHYSREKQLRRIHEEKIIRSEIFKEFPKCDQSTEILALNRRTYVLFSPRHLFKRDLWKLRVNGFSRITFALDFLRNLKVLK